MRLPGRKPRETPPPPDPRCQAIAKTTGRRCKLPVAFTGCATCLLHLSAQPPARPA